MTHCYVCGRKHSVNSQHVGYMETRYFTVCNNPDCDEFGVEIREVASSEYYPNDQQIRNTAGGI